MCLVRRQRICIFFLVHSGMQRNDATLVALVVKSKSSGSTFFINIVANTFLSLPTTTTTTTTIKTTAVKHSSGCEVTKVFAEKV